MRIEVQLLGSDAYMTKLVRASERFRARMAVLLRQITKSLETEVKMNLDNRVLHRHTGKLSRSVHSEVDTMEMSGKVYAGKDAPYGAIHEFGGIVMVPEHERRRLAYGRSISAVTGRGYLGFRRGHYHMVEGIGGTGQVAATVTVRAHQAVFPERSFLRSAAALYRQPFRDRVRALLTETVGKAV